MSPNLAAIKQMFGDTVAPNGLPVHENFAMWFGNSKIVDAEGLPMVMYHGTSKDKDFKKFNITKNGVWFSSDPEVANEYAAENDSQKNVYDRYADKHSVVNTASRVLPVWVNIENPYNPTDEEWEELRWSENFKVVQRQVFQKAIINGHDGIDFGFGTWVVLKNSNQIRSVIDNDGSFGVTNRTTTHSACKQEKIQTDVKAREWDDELIDVVPVVRERLRA